MRTLEYSTANAQSSKDSVIFEAKKSPVFQVGIKMEGRPWHVHQAQGTYDPITNEWLHAPAGTVAQTAGDRSRQDEHDWAANKTGGASPVGGRVGGAAGGKAAG